MKLLAMIPAPWRAGLSIFAVLALLSAAAGLYFKIKHDAYQDGFAAAEMICAREKAAQAAANQEAIRLAGERYLKQVDAIVSENQRLEDALPILDRAAAEDPRARECGISVDSVRRLNAIQ